jgi:transposase
VTAAVSHGELTGFAPVTVAPPVGQLVAPVGSGDPALPADADRPLDGMIEVELPSGVKLRLTGVVEETALRQVLSALS